MITVCLMRDSKKTCAIKTMMNFGNPGANDFVREILSQLV